jgi:transposase
MNLDWGTINLAPPSGGREFDVMAMSFYLPDARSLTDEVLEALRLRAIRGCELGLSECTIADLLGVSRQTVCQWWSDFRSGGLDALPHNRTGRPVGSGRTLSDEQELHLQDILDNKNPEQAGVAAALWTRPAVRELIYKEYGVRMPVRTVGSYLARWGYTCKKPIRHAQKQDAEEVANWLKTAYPAIKTRARLEDAEILWGDETGIAADQHPGRGYARKGHPVTMEVPDSHIRVNMIAAISNEGHLRFMTYKVSLSAELFLVFLQRLIADSERKIFLIVDHLKSHEAEAVQQWQEAHRNEIELFYLPRRAPELNADEYLNLELKSNLHKASLPSNLATLCRRVQSFMRRIRRLTGHIKSYFQHPKVEYAAG